MTPDGPAPGPTADPTAHAPAGLREAKKAATRDALSLAALELALEHGLDAVRGEDVAAAAGVSPRTFRNYFANKYEAIVSRHADRGERTASALAARPPDEPLWDAIERAVDATYGAGPGEPDPATLAALRLILSEPALQAELLRAVRDADARLAAVVAARTGTDVRRDLYPGLVAAAVGAAQGAATEHYLRADPPIPLVPLIRTALRALPAGLPEPGRAGPAHHVPEETR